MTRPPLRRRHASAPGPEFRGNEYPALASFVRGYLHEDFPEVHGSARAAAAAFCANATDSERRQVARELASLVRIALDRSARDLRRFVTRDLGSRWEPESRDQLVELLELIRATI